MKVNKECEPCLHLHNGYTPMKIEQLNLIKTIYRNEQSENIETSE